MVRRQVEVVNPSGLHARPSSALVKAAAQFDAEFHIESYGVRVNGKSILGIMTLAAECGARLDLITEGPEEAQAMEHIVEQFACGFNLDET